MLKVKPSDTVGVEGEESVVLNRARDCRTGNLEIYGSARTRTLASRVMY